MASEDPQPTPAVPDYLLDPNSVTKDPGPWRSGDAPDYSNTRRVWAEGKHQSHPHGGLASMVENLVKNWEIEASFKTDVTTWRTIDSSSYKFSVNGGDLQDAEHMLKVGTYNAIINPGLGNAYYSDKHTDFEKSHEVFKKMMPTFAWEVVEVYAGPPKAVFKWRHWGEMKNDYVGVNDKGEKVTVPAHGRLLDIQGMAIATLNDDFKLTAIEIWFDPMEMFRQIGPAAAAAAEPVAAVVDVKA